MPKQQPTLENLLWQRKWMTSLSQPGPKAEINGVPQAFPAEGQEAAQNNLAQINEMIKTLFPEHVEVE